MYRNFLISILKIILDTHVAIFIFLSFILVNLFYLWVGDFIFSRTNEVISISNISGLLGAAATTFTAITAAILVLNWKVQHNLSQISKLTTEIWDLHLKLSAELLNLSYNFTSNTKESEYKLIMSKVIKIAFPLRTKSQQLELLLEMRLLWDDCEKLEEYIGFLDYFYPWSAPDFIEFRKDIFIFDKDFRYIKSSLVELYKKYIFIQ